MSTYARETSVSVDRSVAEMKATLKRYGASGFGYMEREDMAQVAFEYGSRRVRFSIALPDPQDREFIRTPTGRSRTKGVAHEEWEKAVKQRWRAMNLIVKAKLEAVESKVASFEEEFLPYLILPNGQTVFEQVGEQAITAIEASDHRRLQIEG